MGVSPTSVLRYIKMKCGAANFKLPLDDDQIMDIIYQESLPIFSKYYPYMYYAYVNPETDTIANNEKSSIYHVNTNGLEMMGVVRVFRTDGSLADNRFPYYQSNNVFDIGMATNLQSMVEVPNTIAFHAPDMVELFPKCYGTNIFLVQTKCVHPNSFITIPLTLNDEFKKICEYDVKIAMYPLLKRYDTLNTPYQSIELKIDDFQEAESKRDELIEKWTSKFFREPERKKIWLA